jgi:hypothetical protein
MYGIDYMESGVRATDDMAVSETLGIHYQIVKDIKKNDELYNYILTLGGGQYFSGHIKYMEEGNLLRYKLGELIVILEEIGINPIKLFNKDPAFKRLYQKAFSSQEEILNFSIFKSMKKYVLKLVEKAEECGLLELHNLKKYYTNEKDSNCIYAHHRI